MSYKSSNFRRGQPTNDAPTDRYAEQVATLSEMYPSWSTEDLQSAIQEANGDVETVATRIIEGHVEHWGSVQRKKEKRTSSAAPAAKEGSGRERGEFRGQRGGRAGRGGRGGARGGARGGHRETNGRVHSPALVAETDASGWSTAAPVDAVFHNGEAHDHVNSTEGAVAQTSTDGWGSSQEQTNGYSTDAHISNATSNGWGSETNGHSMGSWGSPAAPVTTSQAGVISPKPVKTPATSKMSWAQIARPQEKPKATPPPPIAAPIQPPAPPREPTPPPVKEEVAPEPELAEPSPIDQGWEDITTGQNPSWDDEPQLEATPVVPSDPVTVTPESASLPTPPPPHASELPASLIPVEPKPQPAPSPLPAQIQQQQQSAEAPIPSTPPAKSVTPVSHGRPVPGSHRASARFKTSDQAVVMPSTSSFSVAMEKIGMQFGSVSLGGDDVSEALSAEPATLAEPAPIPRAPEVKEPVQAPEPKQAAAPAPIPPAIPQQVQQSPRVPSSLPQQTAINNAGGLFQQPIPHQLHQQAQQHTPASPPKSILPPAASTQPQTPQTSISSSSSLPAFNTQQTTPSVSQTSLSSFQSPSHQAPSQQNQSQNQPSSQNQLHQSYAHHVFPSHLESGSTQQSQHTPGGLQQGTTSSHGSYFRQPDPPYFHAPTPPVGQPQDGPYGSFGPLGQQVPHQGQGSHLAQFNDFNYDGGRFYDGGFLPNAGFGGRNALGHDDVSKVLPSGQQQGGASVLPSQASQASQQSNQQAQSGGQGQGQGSQMQAMLPPQMAQFYYPHYQPNQFYGTPYGSGYGLGQFPPNRYQPQQPPLFQPPGASSASPAPTKGPSGLQQSNPYAQGLYGGQHPASTYDDGNYTPPGGLHHGLNQGVSGGLPANEYGKPLYGGQGMQSFMSMAQNSQPSGSPMSARGGGGGASEGSYKTYSQNVGVGKDVGTGGGVTGSQGGGSQVPHGRSGVQNPQGSFYGGNRFSSNNAGSGPSGNQSQTQPQQTQGYPQGSGDGGFYYGGGRSQGQQFWQ